MLTLSNLSFPFDSYVVWNANGFHENHAQQMLTLLTLILAAWLQIWLLKHKTAVTSLLFIKKTEKNQQSSISLYCLIFCKQVFTNMMSFLIILSNAQFYAYFGVLCRCIQGGMLLILTSNPWDWKVTALRQGFWGLKI